MKKLTFCRWATLLTGLLAISTGSWFNATVSSQWYQVKFATLALGLVSAIFAANWIQYQKKVDENSAIPNWPGWLRRLLFSSLLCLTILSAQAQTNWTNQPQTGQNQLSAVAYGAGIYVALGGEDGTIRVSTDGITWTTQVAGSTGQIGLISLVYASSKFVAVGDHRVLTSTDGLTWTPQITNINALWQGVAYGSGKFVAVGFGGAIGTSPDGITWTSQQADPSANVTLQFQEIAFGGGQFVAVGGEGLIQTSPNGITWTSRTSGTAAGLYGVSAGGNGSFVAVGTASTVVTSPNGVTWTPQVVAGPATFLIGVAYNTTTGQYVAAANASNRLLTSTNGLTWTAHPSGTNVWLKAVQYLNGQFIAVGDEGLIRSSTDGVIWKPLTITSDLMFTGISYGNGHYVAVGTYLTDPDISTSQANVAITSDDGITYRLGNPQQLLIIGNGFYDVAFGNGLFATVGSGGNIQTSQDGKTWVLRHTIQFNSLNGIAYGNGRFVGVGPVGLFVSSTDGLNWIDNQTASTGSYRGVTYGNGLFVASGAGGGGGSIATSTDGVTWTHSGAGGSFLNSVAYGNGVYVVVGNSGTVFRSTNGTTWTSQPSLTFNNLNHITFGNGQFVAVGETGVIFTSSNGLTWSARTSNTPYILKGITHGNGLFVAVGNGATITTSSDDGAIPVNLPPVAPVIANAMGTVGQLFTQTLPPFTDPEGLPLTYSVAGLPASLIFTSGSGGTISGTPTAPGVFQITMTATDQGNLSTSAFYTLTINAPGNPPANPASLTITSFTCYSTNAVLSSVDFVVGYGDGTFTPALTDLFINGVTITGHLGQTYTFGFDANQFMLPIQDQASRSTYFVWNFKDACAGNSMPPPPPPPPASLTVTDFVCHYTNAVLSSVDFWVGYDGGIYTPALPDLFINGVTITGQLGQKYTFGFDANQFMLPIQDQASRTTYFVWNFKAACLNSGARLGVESTTPWQVQLLGNPVVNEVILSVQDAQGQSIVLELIDIAGHTVTSQQITPATAIKRTVFDVGHQPGGMLLLRATGEKQSQLLKVVKQ